MVVRTAMLAAALLSPALVASTPLAADAARAIEPVQLQGVSLSGGERMLVHQTLVPAPAAEVWTAISTAEGWKTWAVPAAWLDELKVGATIETSYRSGALRGDAANIHNEVLAYLPARMLAIRATRAPPGFPNPELLADLFTVIELVPADARSTRVTIHMLGYRTDPKYDALWAHFDRGNAFSLAQLRKRFTEGPIDWSRLEGKK